VPVLVTAAGETSAWGAEDFLVCGGWPGKRLGDRDWRTGSAGDVRTSEVN